MTPNDRPAAAVNAEPARVSVGALVGWTALAMVLCGVVLAGVVGTAGMDRGWASLGAATAISAVAATLGMFPVALVAVRGSASQISFAFLAGTMLRVMAAVALLFLAISVYGLPRMSTALFTVAYYACVLAAEVAVLAACMKRTFPVGSSPAAPAIPN